MERITFLNDPGAFTRAGAFVAHIANVSGKQDLLSEISTKLNFPDYFGFNWDALYDCLCDLSWIHEKHIILVHDTKPSLDENGHTIYMGILNDVIALWETRGGIIFEVVFPIA